MHACHILRFVEDLDSEYYLAQAQLYALHHNFLAKPKIFHLRRTLTNIEHQIYSNYSTIKALICTILADIFLY